MFPDLTTLRWQNFRRLISANGIFVFFLFKVGLGHLFSGPEADIVSLTSVKTGGNQLYGTMTKYHNVIFKFDS